MIRAPHEANWPIWEKYVATVPRPGAGPQNPFVRDVVVMGDRSEFPAQVTSWDLIRRCQDLFMSSERADEVPDGFATWIVGRPLWPRDEEPSESLERFLQPWGEGFVGFDEPWGLRIFPAQILDAWVLPELEPPSDAPCWLHMLGVCQRQGSWTRQRCGWSNVRR